MAGSGQDARIPVQPGGGGDFATSGGGLIANLRRFTFAMGQALEATSSTAKGLENMSELGTRALGRLAEAADEAATALGNVSTLTNGADVALRGRTLGIESPLGKNQFQGSRAGGVDVGSVTGQLTTERGRV